ncbi:hypothetical protein ACTFRP_19485 [Bacillus cereus group sp. MYBK234-1]|uniref:hypothetical protein n=1 Tax=unclassified Bacillus cereus group TaxID=2750818 RepID=UPI003F79E13E
MTKQTPKTLNRQELLKRASQFHFVPGHGPDISKMSDEELQKCVEIMESMFENAFKKDVEF